MTKMIGSKSIVMALKNEKVKSVFGIPGGSIMPLFDAIYDSGIRTILTRHEQCAAHMADGFARASGLTGVCLATSGPGATNLVTGLATACIDSSPIVAITGQVSKSMIGKDGFQEADIVGITTPITKYNLQLKNPSEIPISIKTAFHIASTGRPGPVLIDVPRDVQTDTAEMDFSKPVILRGYKPKISPHPIQIKKAVDLINCAEKPLILAGGGVIISNASQDLLQLAEFMLIPIATTLMGKGCVPENHPLSLGTLGMHGTVTANTMIIEADVILAIGTRFSDRTTGRVDQFCKDSKIIHIDIDSAEIGKNVDVNLPIVADAKKAISEIYKFLMQNSTKRSKTLWYERIQQFKSEIIENDKDSKGQYLKPNKLLFELRKILPKNTIFTTEVGQNQMWAGLHLKIFDPRTFITSGGLGTMGFGFPAALGAKVAKPDVPVVDIAGDGSFLMTEQDLATSKIEDIPVIVLILNNNMLGMVAQWQRMFYNRRYACTELKGCPDFVKLAESYGAQAFRVCSMEEFIDSIKKALKSSVTTVIDIPISPEENVFPMIPPGGSYKDMILE